MDLVKTLASQLDIDSDAAGAIAGTVLGGVKGALADDAPEAAAQLDEAVPELGGWQEAAGKLMGGGGALGGLLGGGGAGGLLGAAAGALGGQEARDTAALVALLGKLNIDAGKAALVAPLVLNFLKSRVSPELLRTVLSVAPMLAGGDEEGPAGGLGGALGGLLGR